MKLDIIEEVIEAEKKADKTIKAAETRYRHELEEEERKLHEKQKRIISRIEAKQKKEIEELHKQLDAECKTKQNELQEKISEYDNLPKDQIKGTIQQIIKIILN
jgi:F0F1-type ATP synthase membrane subunit b/b'